MRLKLQCANHVRRYYKIATTRPINAHAFAKAIQDASLVRFKIIVSSRPPCHKTASTPFPRHDQRIRSNLSIRTHHLRDVKSAKSSETPPQPC